ncbi:MAG TPA: hypothetical protein VGB08_11265, partial [Allosphingosinicella sp.]
MNRIGDETLNAYADGELSGLRRDEVERALAEDPELRTRLALQQRLRARVAAHYGPVAEEEVPERLSALVAPAAGHVVDLAAARARRPVWRALAALAAALLLGLFAGSMLPRGDTGPVTVAGGALIARGELAEALERRLASDRGTSLRIGVSFAAADGRFCRIFDAEALSGLACRGQEGWQLVATAAPVPGRAGEFRQASSGNPLILGAAQEMMASEPLNAAAERRAR